MSAAVLDLPKLWDNPVFQRFSRSRLRLRKAVFWYLLTLIVTSFVVTLVYLIQTNSGVPERDAARGLWIPVLVIQGLILMIKGTGAVSAGLIQDRIDQTLDYQRLTPVTPLQNLVGYLFGLPVLEYTLVALTLPHLLFIVVVGEIPIAVLFTVYLAFFTCVVLYHVTAIATGMVMRRWIWGYLLSIFMVGLVNVVLPGLVSQFGLKFLQYLSVWPVIGQKVLPLIVSEPGVATQNPFLQMADAVPFYNWTLSPFTFTLLLQGVLIATFSIMALRRWKSSDRHSLSKPYALALLCAFIVLLIGNVWVAITRQRMPFAIFGQTDLDQLEGVVAIGLPLVYCLIVWFLCFALFAMVIPSHHAYVRGLRRAMKLGRATRPWEDDSASISFMSLFPVVALLGLWVLYREAGASGFFDFLDQSGFSPWRLPAAFGLVVFYSALLLQAMQLKPTVMVILLVWFLPILVAIVSGAAMQSVESLQAVIASVSPLALVLMAGSLPIEHIAPAGASRQLSAMLTGVYTGLAFIAVQIVWLGLRWHRLRAGYHAAAGARTPTPSAEPGQLQGGLTPRVAVSSTR